MNPLVKLDAVTTADGKELALFERSGTYYIKIGGQELMSSRTHGSEEALARLACAELGRRAGARVLVGGLGLGFTLRAALDHLPADAGLLVAEVFGRVVTWNRERLGHLAGHPLRDPRVRVEQADVADLLRAGAGAYDLILLDVDNGPGALTLGTNERLYGARGLARLRDALGRGGVLGLWSAAPEPGFVRRLRRAGLTARSKTVRAREGGRGARHTVFLARR